MSSGRGEFVLIFFFACIVLSVAALRRHRVASWARRPRRFPWTTTVRKYDNDVDRVGHKHSPKWQEENLAC